VAATSRAIGAKIKPDDSGCVSTAIESSNGKGSELLNRFNKLATSASTYRVTFNQSETHCADGGSQYCTSDHTAFVSSFDVGSSWDRKFPGCSVLGGLGPKMAEDLGGIIVHELLGHGYDDATGRSTTGGDSQQRAIMAENIYHRGAGQKERCETRW